jgi:CTP synthase
MPTKFIFVIGGVISGLGKGITTASLGKLLQYQGYSVTAIKIDPYLNQDAGTMRPTEHGEVWVTEDGGEIDQDLGNYERFLGIELHKNHNITNGKVYWSILSKEREGKFLGKTISPIPHVTNEIKDMIETVATEDKTDFVLIEVGGQVGDYENVLFLEAARQMKITHPVLYVLVGYLPIPKHLGEMKTKPMQHAINALGQHNILPDIIVCRSEISVDDIRKEKIAKSCGMHTEAVIANPDVNNIYKIPLILDDQGVCQTVLEHFKVPHQKNCKGINDWRKFIDEVDDTKTKIRVGIVGKYFDIGDFSLADSYISVIESIKHAAWNNHCVPEIIWIDSKKYEEEPESIDELKSIDCIIVPGGFGKSGIEGKIMTAKYCRENNIPYLGLCLGLQIGVIEFARNVCGLKNANSEEFKETEHPVVAIIEEQKKILAEKGYGGTMRLGGWPAVLKTDTQVWNLYNKQTEISERHRHRYEINPKYIEILEKNGFVFSGWNPNAKIMEFGENPACKFFIGTQAHPEFKSQPMKPAPLFDGLIKAALSTNQSELS